MHRALELASKGIGRTNPNPLVGAVIVKDDKVIAEGYHEFFGGPHAEINALRNATESVKGATMYVTLEPCSHYGKTPPCVDAIIESGIKEVVVAMTDPNPLVAGRGIRNLENNEIAVWTGLLEDEAKELNEVFIKYITTKTPYVVMKTAMTLDGKIACKTGESKWISNEKSREYVHILRSRLTGIMVGIGTVLKDDPSLTCRIGEGLRQPRRIIVDSTLKIPLESKVLRDDHAGETIIATAEGADVLKAEKIKYSGAKVIYLPSKDGRVDLNKLMESLGEEEIDSILLEGGGELNYSALKAGIVDKVVTFIAPKILGGKDAPTPVEGEGSCSMRERIELGKIKVSTFGDDVMIEGEVKRCLQD
ncbi:diaminohydroxyphosphoribosylaminopyrimidine deaminase / 5-amino-6-(5-phosphoribosylamino)uracil reductase [Alkalibacter saccharofermentans DSM 14828]|uniref:Riboflavin biosynthesis protein RibD n=2 Tax=Alkalibacter TaxID=274470 RepID=A0A1M4Y0V4_9FIRM|nr:diaminohydroxyphosphoribosylaminopyrimidine deaminase / 5-amino-6-(5-phosphoribosylamino)uracil reductase [Alkalibacter saccharofermentans DSM 14828]